MADLVFSRAMRPILERLKTQTPPQTHTECTAGRWLYRSFSKGRLCVYVYAANSTECADTLHITNNGSLHIWIKVHPNGYMTLEGCTLLLEPFSGKLTAGEGPLHPRQMFNAETWPEDKLPLLRDLVFWVLLPPKPRGPKS